VAVGVAAVIVVFRFLTWLAIRDLQKRRDTQKAPTWRANCRGSLTTDSKFLGLRAGPWTVAQMGVHRIYTGLGLRRVTPYV
jgi:hypothetical protein